MLKIGISTNPNARLAQLRTSSPLKLSLAYVGALRCSGYAIEAEAHRTLAGYRKSGEWFDCPTDMAVAAVGAAAYRLGEPIASVDPRLTDEIVRIISPDAGDSRWLDIIGSVVMFFVKGALGVVLAVVIWCSLYLAWCILTCV